MTSTTITRDRNYYSMCDESDLIRIARDSRDELALVLAERLADFADLEHERDTLRDALDNAREQIDHLRDALDEAKDEIERLDAVINDANLG
jgi:predicted  nucleic acid-binding Zn-ribbon protein